MTLQTNAQRADLFTREAGPIAKAIPCGLAVALAVWTVAFLGRLPLAFTIPAPVLLGALLAVGLIGAIICGRRLGRAVDAMLALIVAGLINILLVGSIVSAASGSTWANPNQITMSGLVWIPGSLIVFAALGLLGGFIGVKWRGSRDAVKVEVVHCQAVFGVVGVMTSIILIFVGALVTSQEMGLAVPDWPTSYEYNMFLFPFTKMIGGIYYEHAHRLIGSLIGLETLILAGWLFVHRPRRFPNGLPAAGVVALVLVIIQGLLGGLRVEGVNMESVGHTLADQLAIVHACSAQLFLIVFAGITWALLTQSDHHENIPVNTPTLSSLERRYRIGTVVALVAMIWLQTLFGAIHRHTGLDWALLTHIFGAATTVLLGLLSATTLLNAPANAIGRRTVAILIMAGVCLQVLLGFGSWWVTANVDPTDQATNPYIANLVSAHVVTGTLLLLLALWTALEVIRTSATPDSGAMKKHPDPANNIHTREGAIA